MQAVEGLSCAHDSNGFAIAAGTFARGSAYFKKKSRYGGVSARANKRIKSEKTCHFRPKFLFFCGL